MARPRPGGAVAIVAAALALATSGCGSRERPGMVVVLGIEGLHLPLLDQLVAEGALPNFARLYREGRSGGVSTAETVMPPLSPRVWNTFATGQLPEVHRIADFVREDGKGKRRLYSSRDRRVPALWEIASASGKRAGVVNWLQTYPAEHVNGFVISERYRPKSTQMLAQWQKVPLERDERGVVYPPQLLARLDGLALAPQTSFAYTAALAEAIDRDVFSLAYAALAEQPVDLLLIYTRSMDELSHLQWFTHEPRPEEHPAHDEVVDFMRRYDALLGELLAHLHPADHLIVLSDHGMERAHGPKGLSGEHQSLETATGVLVLFRPRVAPGAERVWASALDVAPTVLDLLGIPPAQNMPGRVLSEAFRPDRPPLPRRPQRYVRRLDAESAPTPGEDERQFIDRLKALGYVQSRRAPDGHLP